jgi:hypothetical protein
MPHSSLFLLTQADGETCSFSVNEAELRKIDHMFEWKEGMQYWWTNVCDIGRDRDQEGKQLTLIGTEGEGDTLAVFKGWPKEEIAIHAVKISAIRPWHRLLLRKIAEPVQIGEATKGRDIDIKVPQYYWDI